MQFHKRQINIAIVATVIASVLTYRIIDEARPTTWQAASHHDQNFRGPVGMMAARSARAPRNAKAVPFDALDPFELTLPPFHPDPGLMRCIDQAEGYTLRTKSCVLSEVERQLPVMAAVERRIMHNSSQRTRHLFVRSHRDWEIRVARKCNLDPEVVAYEGGLLADLAYSFCCLDGVLGRIRWLQINRRRRKS